MLLASIDGTITPVSEATIPVTDEGLIRGDGVFEVVRLHDGVPYALDEHLERMERSADTSLLPFDAAATRADLEALLAAAEATPDGVRLMQTRGGRRIAILEELPSYPPSIALASVTYAPTRVLDGVKTLSYGANMLCSRLAREQGADEALLVTPHGRVLEAPTSSIFYVAGGRLCTPPLTDHILDSITRRKVLAVAEVDERPTTLDEIKAADEAFLASTARDALAVHAIDDVRLGDAPGPVTRDVAAKVAALVARELAAAR